jgi:hypothetical protein
VVFKERELGFSVMRSNADSIVVTSIGVSTPIRASLDLVVSLLDLRFEDGSLLKLDDGTIHGHFSKTDDGTNYACGAGRGGEAHAGGRG